MRSSVATGTDKASMSAPFLPVFRDHVGVSWWRASHGKTDPAEAVTPDALSAYRFITPSRSVGAFLVVDIDRRDAVLDAYATIPREIWPSWLVETPHGAQVGWLIDPVDLRPEARPHPVRYARAVGLALRAALRGDEAVDPLTAPRVRNPACEAADVRAGAQAPVYALGALRAALVASGQWSTQRLTPAEQARTAIDPGGVIPEGERNCTVFDVCRFAAYRGEDFAAAAWEAAERCAPPLSVAEVRGIVRSVEAYMSKTERPTGTGTTPEAVRDLMADLGRRGGSRHTEAQRAARAKGPAAASVVRQTEAVGRAAMIVHLSETEGLSHAQIAKRLGVHRDTVKRALRGARGGR